MSGGLLTNCTLCQSSLEINETGKAVYCKFCDRKPDILVQLLDRVRQRVNVDLIKNSPIGMHYCPYCKEKTIYLGENNMCAECKEKETEVVVQYHCIKCERPTNQYGFCLWCEDELREAL